MANTGMFFGGNNRLLEDEAIAPAAATPELLAPIMPQQILDQQLEPEQKGGGFGDILRMMAGGALDGVATHYGAQPGYANAQEQGRKYWQAVMLQQQKLQMQQAGDQAERQAKRREPQRVGNSIVTMGEGGEYRSVYQQPGEFERYATARGFKPGSPEYSVAAEDFVLRSNGPSALDYDQQLDDYRTGNRVRLEGLRQGNRAKLESQRQGNRLSTRGAPTYRAVNPLPQTRRTGPARPTATSANGQKVEWDGKAWVPSQ